MEQPRADGAVAKAVGMEQPPADEASIAEPVLVVQADSDDDDDDDYDPFAEEPAPNTGPIAGGMQVLNELKDLVRKAQEESMQSIASIQVVTSHLSEALSKDAPPAPPDEATQPDSGPPEQVPPVVQPVARRMRAGARLAQEYFGRAGKGPGKGEPPAKRQRVDAVPRFAAQLLDKAPKEVQTCQSLLKFFNKKLEAAFDEGPAVAGPARLKRALELFAEMSGRVAGLREPKGWDARAKRVLDIASHAASPAGVDALTAAEKELEGEQAKLSTQLKDEDGGLEAAIKGRRLWAKDLLRREWLSWCARLLQAREKMLLEKAERSSPAASAKPDVAEAAGGLDAAAIFNLLLAGKAQKRAQTIKRPG